MSRNGRTLKLFAIVFVLTMIGLYFAISGCSKKQFDKVSNGFRTIGIGMSREQVLDRIKSDDRFLSPPAQPYKDRLMVITKIKKYDASVDFCFNSANILRSIRISIGEAGEHYLADQPIQYIYNVLGTRFGKPTVGSNKTQGLDMYTWDAEGVNWTLFRIKYRISTGRYLVLFISDPKETTKEEDEMRKIQSIDKNFFQHSIYPEETIVSEDFLAAEKGTSK